MKTSRFLSLTVRANLLALLASVVLPVDSVAAQQGTQKSQSQIVAKILDVMYAEEEINPPNLVVTAIGEDPTAGYQQPTLERATYVVPPADGIQDYFLRATPPSGDVAQVVSKVKAKNTWKGYTEQAPWMKGIRVHGAGDGVIIKMFSGEPAAVDRTFEGESNDGQLQAALDKAFTQLDKALAEGGDADAVSTWMITNIAGQRGSIAGLRTLKVTITATRTPAWDE